MRLDIQKYFSNAYKWFSISLDQIFLTLLYEGKLWKIPLSQTVKYHMTQPHIYCTRLSTMLIWMCPCHLTGIKQTFFYFGKLAFIIPLFLKFNIYMYITYVYITRNRKYPQRTLIYVSFNTISNLQLSTVSDTKFRYERWRSLLPTFYQIRVFSDRFTKTTYQHKTINAIIIAKATRDIFHTNFCPHH